jgi:hypothetical protein
MKRVEDGVYERSFTAEEAGTWAAWLPPEESLGDDKLSPVSFNVRLSDIENREPVLDEPALKRLAADTGGRYVTLGELDRLVGAIGAETVVVPRRREFRDLRRELSVPIVAILLATAEWILRKRFRYRVTHFMKRTALVLAFASTLAVAQRWQESPGNTSKVSVPDEQDASRSNSSRSRRRRATSIVRSGLLQELLDRWPDKVIESFRAQRMPSETDQVVPGDRYVGLRAEVMRRITALPQGVATYRKREDTNAGRLFEQALATRDEEALRGLVTSRWLTSFGPRAASALADLLFEDGRPAESFATAKSALAEAPDDLDAVVKSRLAARLMLAAYAAGDAAALAEARADFGGLSFDVDGTPTLLHAFADRLGGLLPKTRERTPPSLAPFGAQPLFARGLRTQDTRDVFDGGTISAPSAKT